MNQEIFFVSPKELSKLLRITERRVLKWLRDNNIEPIEINPYGERKTLRIPISELPEEIKCAILNKKPTPKIRIEIVDDRKI